MWPVLHKFNIVKIDLNLVNFVRCKVQFCVYPVHCHTTSAIVKEKVLVNTNVSKADIGLLLYSQW